MLALVAALHMYPALVGLPAAAGGFFAGWALKGDSTGTPFPIIHLLVASVAGLATSYFAPSLLIAVPLGAAAGFGYSYFSPLNALVKPSAEAPPNNAPMDAKEVAREVSA